jgi:hypothetical protein
MRVRKPPTQPADLGTKWIDGAILIAADGTNPQKDVRDISYRPGWIYTSTTAQFTGAYGSLNFDERVASSPYADHYYAFAQPRSTERRERELTVVEIWDGIDPNWYNPYIRWNMDPASKPDGCPVPRPTCWTILGYSTFNDLTVINDWVSTPAHLMAVVAAVIPGLTEYAILHETFQREFPGRTIIRDAGGNVTNLAVTDEASDYFIDSPVPPPGHPDSDIPQQPGANPPGEPAKVYRPRTFDGDTRD